MSSRERFRELLAQRRPLLMDGATGTELYNRGVFINRSFEEANLTNPGLVLGLHGDYVKAGSGAILTNSWGANRFKLAAHSLGEKTGPINAAAAELAREAAGDSVYVGGSVGPLGKRLAPLGPISPEDAFEAFSEQMSHLVASGVDFLYLETFSDMAQLEQALRAARLYQETVPVAASLTINLAGELAQGGSLEEAIGNADTWGADIVGLNCSVGPQPTLSAIERVKSLTTKPLCVKPNAGLPREIDGRTIYMSTPEYVATYTRNFLQAGVQLVGGCCGTTPAHVKSMAQAYRHYVAMYEAPGKRENVTVTGSTQSGKTAQDRGETRRSDNQPPVERVPFREKSRWSRKIADGETVYALELLPPAGVETGPVLDRAARVKEAGLDVINLPDGPRASSRMSTTLTAILIEQQVGIETVLHYTCRDRNLIGMQSDLLGIHSAGLRNMLLITGDPPKVGNYPDATGVFDVDAIGLTTMAHRLNGGVDIGNRSIGRPTALSLGVAVNPVHRDFDYEMDRFARKVEAGAEWAISQPVFDEADMLRFLEHVDRKGIRIPVIVGLWPLTSLRNAEFMNNEVPGVSVPAQVMRRMAEAQSKEEALQTGVEIARQLHQRLRKDVQGFQISAPFGRIDLALNVVADQDQEQENQS